MSQIDLATALNMFKQGAQELSLSRAIGSANDQVNQIRASEASEQDKRAQLQGIANGLTAHMAQIGAPATTIQAVVGALGPKQYANANAMNLDAQMTGDAGLAAEAQKQQTFENNKAFELAKIKAQAHAAAAADPMREAKLQMQKDFFATKQFNDLGKDLDQSAASARSGFGMMGLTGQRGDRIRALLGDPSQFKNLNGTDATLIGEGLANMVKNGVATEQEIHALVPALANQKISDWKTFLTSNPAALNAPGMFQKYQDILNKESTENNVQTVDTILKRASNRMKVYDLDPTQFKATVANSLRSAGVDVKPDDVIVDKKNGVTIPQMQQINDKSAAAETYIKKAYLGIKSSDPQVQQEASMVFNKLGINPNMAPTQAVEAVRRRIRRGQI